jgi:hypothetical protein
MFKRVDRRRKRQEEAEDLGLDEDMKEIMGLNETDSSESESESESGSSSDADPGEQGSGEEDGEGDEDEELEEDGAEDEEDEDAGESSNEDDLEDIQSAFSISAALLDPVQLLPSEKLLCLLCPFKRIRDGTRGAHEASQVCLELYVCVRIVLSK